MAITTFTVPDPPAGVDFSYMVPGRDIENILGVTATLVASSNPVAAAPHDASGNNHTGAYVNGGALTLGVPGLVTGDTAIQFAAQNFSPNSRVTFPANVFVMPTSFTVLVWVTGGKKVAFAGDAAGFTIACESDTSIGQQILTVGSSADVSNFTALAGPGGHMLAWTWNSGSHAYSFYIDGVLNHSGTVNPFFAPADPFNYLLTNAWHNYHTGTAATVMDELALWSRVLTGAQITGIYAARGTFAGYTAAVLAQTPNAYYHFDDTTTPGPNRTVTLEVSDGTHNVGAYPPLTVQADASTETYTWLPTNSQNVPVPNASAQTVGIPHLSLPPGYTIGPSTGALHAHDQWTNITVWYDQTDNYGGRLTVDYLDRLVIA